MAHSAGRPSAAPTRFVWIERNLIELEDAAAAIRGRGEGLVARDNTLVGSARTGIAVGGRPGSATRPRVVVGNDVSGLTVGDVDVTITGDAIGAVVVCVGPTTVRDGGRGSVVSCD